MTYRFDEHLTSRDAWKYIPEHNADFFSTIVEHADFQPDITRIEPERRRLTKNWAFWLLFAGIGQYSIDNGPAGLIAGAQNRMRMPDYEYEDSIDQAMLTDQIADDGVMRLDRIYFHTRVFPGEVPNSLDEFTKDVSLAMIEGPLVSNAGFYLFHAVNGLISGRAFDSIEEITGQELPFTNGEIFEKDSRLMYHHPIRQHPEDISIGKFP